MANKAQRHTQPAQSAQQAPARPAQVDEVLHAAQIQDLVEDQRAISDRMNDMEEALRGLAGSNNQTAEVLQGLADSNGQTAEVIKQLIKQLVDKPDPTVTAEDLFNSVDPARLRDHMNKDRPVAQATSRFWDRPYLKHVADAWPVVRDGVVVSVLGLTIYGLLSRADDPLDDGSLDD